MCKTKGKKRKAEDEKDPCKHDLFFLLSNHLLYLETSMNEHEHEHEHEVGVMIIIMTTISLACSGV